ncbi:MAG: hypothetical protein ACNS64_01835, partial [Candidatus Halalkalibacterium sp. M3_1C_030]
MMPIRRILFLIALGLLAFIFNKCTDTATNPPMEDIPRNYSHVEQPGTAANDFLADSNFTHLILEVDYMPGYAPDGQALDSLKGFFEQRLNKNSITIKEPTVIDSRGKERYSANEIRNIEEAERSTFSSGDTLAAYMIIVDGKYEERDLLGIAYYNTSNAFFGPSYEEASSGIGPPSRYQ